MKIWQRYHGAGQWLATLLLCSQLSAGQTESVPQRLRWKFQNGDQYRLVYSQQTHTSVTAGDRPAEMRNTLELGLEMDWRVIAVAETGAAKIAQSFTRFTIKMVPEQGDPVQYDSRSPAKHQGVAIQQARQFEPLLQARFTVNITARGEVVDVQVSEETVKLLAKRGVRAAWKRILTRAGLTELLRHSMAPLPPKQVAPGDTWQVEEIMPTPFGKATQTSTYTWQKPADAASQSLARIAVITRTAYPATAHVKTHDQKGTLCFNARAGYLTRAELHQRLVSEDMTSGTAVVASVESRLRLIIERRREP